MIQYHYNEDSWHTFSDGIKKEWVLTNGIGGYAGSSLINAHNRTHQGYLIASLHPPIERYLVFSKLNEQLFTKTASYNLETAQHLSDCKTVYTEGQAYLTDVCYDGNMHFTYQTECAKLTRHITLKHGQNLCAIGYEIENSSQEPLNLVLTPLFNFREHSDSSTPETLSFETRLSGNNYFLTPEKDKSISILFQISEGTFSEKEEKYDCNMQLQTEVDLETDGLDCHYTPVEISISIPAGAKKNLSVLCSVIASHETVETSINSAAAFQILDDQAHYIESLYKTAGYHDAFANQLVLASEQFLSYRASTGLKTILAGLPWFTDWGRDTMIAFTGLTLCTHRYKEAEEILLTFSKYIKNGIVPNMFPDNNMDPLYNTADASLWYFYAVYKYLQYNPTPAAYSFIRELIYPHLKEIIYAYKDGTDFSIYMEEDGLIHAGSGLDQITWMDVRVGEWVVTPRHGKPVEINALWYNALKVMEELSEKFEENASFYHDLSEKTKKSFCNKFWNKEKGCLYDVIDGDEPDDHLRPNQIYAVSLPFTMLSEEQEASIVSFVRNELFVGCGLRSLSTDHADYHGIYCGALPKRDAAYHQGTAWGFLLGGFFTAFLKVHHHSKESIEAALFLLGPIREHLNNSGCIGSISEIFDGDEPHLPRGCYAQAWSVGEVFRCYVEDILPYLNQ